MGGCHITVKLDGCRQQGAKAWLTFLVCKPAQPDLSFMVLTPPPDNWELVVGTFTIQNVRNIKSKVHRFLCRLFFAWSLFAWQHLSPRWTVTQSTFKLSTGSTATQSTGAANILINLLWILQTLWLWFLGSWISGFWQEDDCGKPAKLPIWRILLLIAAKTLFDRWNYMI